MSYQVFARKLRPTGFDELVGQEHVVRALVHALEHERVHHAYLFTGTRGVGKTTIARILAKCLNCETGVTATPCGVCSACREIAEGRFDRALALARRAVEVDPTADNLQILVIGICRHLGAHAAAAEQYATYSTYLRDELGVEPPTFESIRPGLDR